MSQDAINSNRHERWLEEAEQLGLSRGPGDPDFNVNPDEPVVVPAERQVSNGELEDRPF